VPRKRQYAAGSPESADGAASDSGAADDVDSVYVWTSRRRRVREALTGVLLPDSASPNSRCRRAATNRARSAALTAARRAHRLAQAGASPPWLRYLGAYLTPPLVYPFVMLQPLQQPELTRLCIRATSLTTCLYARRYYGCIRVYSALDGHCLCLATLVIWMRWRALAVCSPRASGRGFMIVAAVRALVLLAGPSPPVLTSQTSGGYDSSLHSALSVRRVARVASG
jgi:hypothetical protein